ncbi:MAG: Nif3-like dinuclear metal center hexameric protein [Bacteroidales bacterium]|nr:Nif3-like dinuclear metal center hexameric protein [Bacteroidales bacterium]
MTANNPTPTNGEIIAAIRAYAPECLQESYDNSGLQVGVVSDMCSGVLLCVDLGPEVVEEAVELGCNLIISHHPLLFKGLKSITGATRQEQTVIAAIRHGITLYSAHTSLDNAMGGVSCEMVERLGLPCSIIGPLQPSADSQGFGSGIVVELASPMTGAELVSHVKSTFGASTARCSHYPSEAQIRRVALCGGAGGSFIADAMRQGALAYITADVRYHDFVDHRDELLIIDIGHYESEECTKAIFSRIISEKFPNFAVRLSARETNPITYM